MSNDWFTEWFERSKKSQERADSHHETVQRCNKCKNSSSCHAYIPNCGAFRPR